MDNCNKRSIMIKKIFSYFHKKKLTSKVSRLFIDVSSNDITANQALQLVEELKKHRLIINPLTGQIDFKFPISFPEEYSVEEYSVV